MTNSFTENELRPCPCHTNPLHADSILHGGVDFKAFPKVEEMSDEWKEMHQDNWRVICYKCRLMMFGDSREDVIKRWNTRDSSDKKAPDVKIPVSSSISPWEQCAFFFYENSCRCVYHKGHQGPHWSNGMKAFESDEFEIGRLNKQLAEERSEHNVVNAANNAIIEKLQAEINDLKRDHLTGAELKALNDLNAELRATLKIMYSIVYHVSSFTARNEEVWNVLTRAKKILDASL